MLSLNEIARRLGIGLKTVKHWRDHGLLTGRLANDKGEYLYYPPPPGFTRPRIGRPPHPRPPTPEETPTESAQGGAV
jgi:hypothetical protein